MTTFTSKTVLTDPGDGWIDGLHLRKTFGRDEWRPPCPHGTGWSMVNRAGTESVLVTAAGVDGRVLIHASMTRADHVPTYEDLVLLHRAVWLDGRHQDGHAYLCFVPPAEHVNFHPRALHLYGWRDGGRMVPDMAMTIETDGQTMRMI